MTNRHIRRALLEKLGVTRQALSLRVKKLQHHVPITTTDATYVIAHRNGIELDRFLAPELANRVRALLPTVPDIPVKPRRGGPPPRISGARGK
jgi:hypothetical protein